MAKAFGEVRREMAEQTADTLACRYCGAATTRETFSALGARCRPCFEVYQRQGYSGLHQPPEIRQAPWVKAEAQRARQGRATRGPDGNAFAALSQQLQARKADRESVRGLDDDEVNALLDMEAGR